MLKRLNSLWLGDRLGYLERLCLASATAVGHPVTLYSYTPDSLKGMPDGIEVRDAREVMPEQRLVTYADSGSFALGFNFFRYELLANNLGYWIDADIYLLKSLDFKQQYVLGWEYENTINSAVLFLPSDSDMVRELCELPFANRCPQWFGPRRSFAYYWKYFLKGPINAEDMPWGTFGPLMVTFLVKKYKVADQAQRPSVFYRVKWTAARSLYGPAHAIEQLIAPDTHSVHLYNSRLVGLNDRPPPAGSYIDAICRKHSIDAGN